LEILVNGKLVEFYQMVVVLIQFLGENRAVSKKISSPKTQKGQKRKKFQVKSTIFISQIENTKK